MTSDTGTRHFLTLYSSWATSLFFVHDGPPKQCGLANGKSTIEQSMHWTFLRHLANQLVLHLHHAAPTDLDFNDSITPNALHHIADADSMIFRNSSFGLGNFAVGNISKRIFALEIAIMGPGKNLPFPSCTHTATSEFDLLRQPVRIQILWSLGCESKKWQKSALSNLGAPPGRDSFHSNGTGHTPILVHFAGEQRHGRSPTRQLTSISPQNGNPPISHHSARPGPRNKR
mmetsp:Transcript_39115/g.93908  ORF Transcript_39115/g.93908 Transcript_39115/m.93908 type:complete len:230 (+) Transcript_39115:336-1025(+)